MTSPVIVFGGPYSNLAALTAMKQKSAELQVPATNIICTGDVVAYCAQAQETIDLIRDWGIHVVQGNCEDSLANDKEDCGCGFDEESVCDIASKQWFAFARKAVNKESKNWMATLPTSISFSYNHTAMHVIHGGLEQQNQFIFASSSTKEKQKQLETAHANVMIGGHCGIPFGQQLDANHYWLNAGVIGMPANDGEASTWYMTLSKSASHIEVAWHRLRYTVSDTVSAMQTHQLCPGYAEALESGLWPSLDILPDPERKQVGEKMHLATIKI
ncbi:metallophosphoesterase [Oleiphilus sp. HI0079]|uniref:metallophosphoesterase family protein n=3 Tax=unclassified Oleiphilus TaxID=2631174 RepID=UPI001E291E2B|nr:metallophosphoesterase family protein [Oleiphilus sp. HI0079]